MAGARQYRTRPTVVLAQQWDGTEASAQSIRVVFGWDSHEAKPVNETPILFLTRQLGSATQHKAVSRGGWIVRNADGEQHTMDDAKFRQRHEVVPLLGE